MDYSLLFIKVAVDQHRHEPLKRMPAMVYHNDERGGTRLVLQEIDTYRIPSKKLKDIAEEDEQDDYEFQIERLEDEDIFEKSRLQQPDEGVLSSSPPKKEDNEQQLVKKSKHLSQRQDTFFD